MAPARIPEPAHNWAQFHDPKTQAMAAVAEAGELAAEYRWIANAGAALARLVDCCILRTTQRCMPSTPVMVMERNHMPSNDFGEFIRIRRAAVRLSLRRFA